MYSRPIIYKVYSVFILVFSILSFITTLAVVIADASSLNVLLPERMATGYIVIMIITNFVSVFLSYIEFSSMYTFAKMIEHEKSGAPGPFHTTGITLPAKFYKYYGPVMFFLILAVEAISVLAILVIGIISKLPIFWILIVPLLFAGLSVFLSYITYYCRYSTFGDLLEVKCSTDLNADTVKKLERDKPSFLRGYCVFLYVIAIISFIASIISIIFIGLLGIILIIAAIVWFIVLAVIGCYFDDLAMMQEHYVLIFKKSHLSR